MAARVTRQMVEILVSNVSSNIFHETPSDALSLTDLAGHANLLFRSVTDTLSLVSDGISVGQFPESITHTLTLTDKVDLLNQPETHVLGLSDLATAILDTSPSVSDTLSLTDSATFMDARQVMTGSTLAITQTVRQNFVDRSVNDVLTLSQSNDFQGPRYLAIRHVLHLNDTGHENAANPHVADFINLKQSAGISRDATATSTISLTDLAYVSHPATSTLALAQAVFNGKGHTDFDRLTLTHSVSTGGSQWNRPFNQGLNLNDGAVYSILRPCTLRQYSPFIGGASGPFTPPPATEPAIGKATLTLTHPFVSPTTTLVLRNPEFGDKEDFIVDVITRRTLGGSYIVFSDPAWLKINTFKMTVRLLKPSSVAAFLTFIRTTVGQEIGLLDYENRQYRGVITNPDAAITQDDRPHYTINIEFEGTLA